MFKANRLLFRLVDYQPRRLSTLTHSIYLRNKIDSQLLGKQTFSKNFYLNMSKPTINYFAHSFIDRSSEKRKDDKWLDQQLRSNESVFILFHVDRPFVKVDSQNKMFSLSRLNYSQVKFLLDSDNSDSKKNKNLWLFLGVQYEKNADYQSSDADGGGDDNNWSLLRSPYSDPQMYNKQDKYRSWFAIDTNVHDSNSDSVLNALKEHGQFFEGNFLKLMAIHDLVEASIIAQARAVFCWHDRNKFCSTCGTLNKVEEAGFKLACDNDKCKSKDKSHNKFVPSNIHYPRVDPVVIMLIVNPARTHFLLGRKKQFPEKMFSCLAGYVEAGESIEEAVRRETFEEAGIYTNKVVYHSSQPWPFPSTLMIGCLAYATSSQIEVDMNEIQEARWFSLDEIDLITQNKHPDKFVIPGERTIANQLINYFSKNKSKL